MDIQFSTTPQMFGVFHIAALAVIALGCIGAFFLLRRMNEARLLRLIWILGAVMLLLEVWKQVVKSGCEIGNHSWGHTNLTKLKGHEIEFQMLRTQQKVDAVLGYHYPMQVMRPPFGATNKLVADSVFEVGYPAVVKWDVSETNSAKAIKAVQNGSILLFHARARDVRCLRKLIPLIFEKGFDCVTVSELLELGPIEVDEHSDMYIYDPKSGM